jgi:hypothetical protein
MCLQTRRLFDSGLAMLITPWLFCIAETASAVRLKSREWDVAVEGK